MNLNNFIKKAKCLELISAKVWGFWRDIDVKASGHMVL